MLDRLRAADDAGVPRGAHLELLDDFLAFLDQAVDRLACLTAGSPRWCIRAFFSSSLSFAFAIFGSALMICRSA
jgi:hypothetical protein